ncbi:MAG: hypothetical protein H7641_04630 [Candidatus Heimdallarchaeota archaeon]|nr:hypothetical protein [Candidatus Heimdallarchaeota archaeon]MCK4876845.1 hypothetical protein [Candidatus Heimdallarchaeota archaeon]
MTLHELSKPQTSTELKDLLEELYGEDISPQDLIDTAFLTKQAKINLVEQNNDKIGYLIWFLEREKDEESEETIDTLIIDEIVIMKTHNNIEVANLLIQDIENLEKKNKVSNIEITLPSQSFWLIPSFIDEGGYSSSMLRVSKELAKKTEFIQIYNTIEKGIKPELIELMISKNDTYQLEIIEEPKDYRSVIENGFTPEIVSMLFYVEDVDMEKTLERINSITDWQEYTISLIKRINN